MKTYVWLGIAGIAYLLWKQKQAQANVISPAAASGALGAQSLFNLLGSNFD